MSLLTPSFGLLFWMVVTFAFVFILLAKFGFPVITRMVDERREYIRHSLEIADEANKKFENIKQETESMLNEARIRQSEILKNAMSEGNQIIEVAKAKASVEAQKKVTEALKQIQDQKQKAMHEMYTQLGGISIGIAEKILRHELESSEEKHAFITNLLDEASTIRTN